MNQFATGSIVKIPTTRVEVNIIKAYSSKKISRSLYDISINY